MSSNLQKSDEELIKSVDAVINEPTHKRQLKAANVIFALGYSVGIALLIVLRAVQGHSSITIDYVLVLYIILGLCLIVYLLYMMFIRKELPSPWGWLFGSVGKGAGAYILGTFYMAILIGCFALFWPAK
jgi:hypothetical protein